MRRVLDGPSVSPSLRDTLVLRERALQSTTVSVVISDLRLPDNPLVWVNTAFSETTGYAAEQVIGRNCRFLQGPDTDPEPVLEMRLAVKEQRASMVTLLNYRADGSAFWNSVSTAPVCDGDGDVIGFIAMQIDVTEQVLAQQDREARLRPGTGAPAGPETDKTVALLGRVSDALAGGEHVEDIMDALVAELVPAFADGCAVDLVGGDPGSAAVSRRRVAAMSVSGADDIGDPGLVERVLRTARPVSLIDHVDGAADDLGTEALLVVPIRGRRGVLGALTLVSGIGPRRYTDAHLAIALDVGRRAGLAVETVRLLAQERTAAGLLHAALTPPLPELPDLEFVVDGWLGAGWYDVWTDPPRSHLDRRGLHVGAGVPGHVRCRRWAGAVGPCRVDPRGLTRSGEFVGRARAGAGRITRRLAGAALGRR